MQHDDRVLILHPQDNIGVATTELQPGTEVSVAGTRLRIGARIDIGHKFAIRAIAKGERVIKYSAPIGRASADISAGESVHLHNLASDYIPTYTLDAGHEFH